MVTDAAFAVAHVSVEVPPAAICAGDAEKLTCGAAGALTVTVAVAVFVPPAPLAVRVYVVVAAGITIAEPLSACAPTPLSIETLVAFVVVQVSVDDSPAVIDVGLALNEIVGGGVTVT